MQEGASSERYFSTGQKNSPMSVRCSLPSEPVSHNSGSVNFSALHEPGYDFDRLHPGCALLNYTIHLSNDGRKFSESILYRVYDSLCMDCSDSNNCVIKVKLRNAIVVIQDVPTVDSSGIASCIAL